MKEEKEPGGAEGGGKRFAYAFYVTNNLLYYKDVMTKLLIFKLYTTYDRIVYLDTDQLILQSIDHLFDIPLTSISPVAAPRMHWSNLVPDITSTLLVIDLSEGLWNRIESRMSRLVVGEYDMDVINDEFRHQMVILPAKYCSINSVWEISTPPIFATVAPAADNATRLYEYYLREAVVAHFSALGKSWSFTREQAERLKPDAHPVFWELYGRWHGLKERACV
ncbi:hypothetical protein HK097_008205 [Rhizophlyctis rosea]|uniref:Nucleotide-diphospho-sugar transferase n=1 Tax=Rhizophlyctis rosea TaxID=64517 RepID=A0AAD5X4F2_9FUNG|nr:hypothetical protein HK097_008205 [Rhizophlyctis rosea]